MKKIKNYLLAFLLVLVLWLSISIINQAILCPQLTQTEMLLRIPKIFVANYYECESR